MTKRSPERAFLGVGWTFPVCLSGGRIQMSEYEQDIKEAIRVILMTNPGERVMRPDFGAGLTDFLFEPLSTTTLEQIRTRVNNALVDWEPRIDIQTITVTVDNSEPNKVLIAMSYWVRATNTLANLVYPFYLGEGSGI
jgi:phage baseplate assembly protein W